MTRPCHPHRQAGSFIRGSPIRGHTRSWGAQMRNRAGPEVGWRSAAARTCELRDQVDRRRRGLVLSAVLAAAAGLGACGIQGDTARRPVPSIAPARPGHQSPAAAAWGFVDAWAARAGANPGYTNSSACSYVLPSDHDECNLLAVGLSAGALGIGDTSTSGTRAIVSVIIRHGCFLVTVTPPTADAPYPFFCFSNTSVNSGQPSSPGAFASAYTAVLSQGLATGGFQNQHHAALACEEIGGLWYVDLQTGGPDT